MTGNGTTSPPPPARPDAAWRWLRLARTACRFLLAAVLLMAALTKITDLSAFEAQVVRHGQLPALLEAAVIHVLPWLELICGASLALGYARREAALLAMALLVGFIVHSLLNYAERDCGCFLFPSLVPQEIAWWQPLRNALLLAAGILVWSGPERMDSTPNPGTH